MEFEQVCPTPLRPGLARTRVLTAPAAVMVGREVDLLIGVGLAAIAIVLLEILPGTILQDTWLALLAGREVSEYGLPHTETLTVFAHGRAWIDQQWLSQVVMYWIYRVGGINANGMTNVVLIVLGLGGGAAAARRLGASARSVIRVLPIAACVVVIGSEVRTQPFAYPLFVATFYLLARDSRQPSSRVYWCLPLVTLWGNLHGSAILGAGLVSMRGLTVLWEQRRLRSWSIIRRGGILAFAAPACLLITPYGISILSYYRATVLSNAFAKYIAEWQPVTALPEIAALFFILAGVTIWSFGRHRLQTTLWERCAILLLAAGSIIALRNLPWFGMASLIVLPLSLTAAIGARSRSPRSHPIANLGLATVAVLALLVAIATTPSRSQQGSRRTFPAGALAAVKSEMAAQPGLRVFADERYADWLLWRLPRLRGHVAYDARFELLTSRQLLLIARLKLQVGLDWKRAASSYQLIVLDRSAEPSLLAAFAQEPGRRVLFSRDGVLVLLRGRAAASR